MTSVRLKKAKSPNWRHSSMRIRTKRKKSLLQLSQAIEIISRGMTNLGLSLLNTEMRRPTPPAKFPAFDCNDYLVWPIICSTHTTASKTGLFRCNFITNRCAPNYIYLCIYKYCHNGKYTNTRTINYSVISNSWFCQHLQSVKKNKKPSYIQPMSSAVDLHQTSRN